MFIAAACDKLGGCRVFGPFKTQLAAREWSLESQGLGFFPMASFTIYEVEEPIDLGFDPGL